MCKLSFVLFLLVSLCSLRPFFLYLFSFSILCLFSLRCFLIKFAFLSLAYALCFPFLSFDFSSFLPPFSLSPCLTYALSIYLLYSMRYHWLSFFLFSYWCFLFIFSFSQFSLYLSSSVLPFSHSRSFLSSFSLFPYRRIPLRIYFILCPVISTHFFLIFLLFTLLSLFFSRLILINIFPCSVLAELSSSFFYYYYSISVLLTLYFSRFAFHIVSTFHYFSYFLSRFFPLLFTIPFLLTLINYLHGARLLTHPTYKELVKIMLTFKC